YGLNAIAGGGDIPLPVKEPTEVKFYYDHKTHWVTDSFNTVIAVASGDFQQALGCASNNDAGCLRSWLQDPDGDGMFAFSTTRIPAGTYSVAVALYEDNAQIAVQAQEFTVADNAEVYFGYDAGKGTLIVSTEGAPRGNITKQQAHWVTRDT
ncbi:MAG TPA: DUF3372 domain-containing protein, partial [Anaerolineae bacterium]|nr:DUF3372 domain-containing protein [Anaerolineae bacterium]